MRIVTGHQSVYLPWLGLFHKASLADVFVYMDDVQYLRQDWNNRNRIKTSNGPAWLTVPVSLKNSASEMLKDIRVAEQPWPSKRHWQREHWRSLQFAYRKAPYWDRIAPWFEQFYTAKPWKWLSELNLAQLRHFFELLSIDTELVIADEYGFEGVRSDLVLDHCRKLNGELCVTGTLGRDYIREQDFIKEGVSLYYQDYQHPTYTQRFGEFESHLSVIDLLMNHGPEARSILLSGNVTRAELEQRAMSDICPGQLVVSRKISDYPKR